MKKKAEKLTRSMGKCIAVIALKAATINANTTCAYIAHQPKLPESVKKLRKI